MKSHRLDPTALIAGLLFALSGLAIVADQTWDDVDVAAIVGGGVAVLGVFLVVLLVTRQVHANNQEIAPD